MFISPRLCVPHENCAPHPRIPRSIRSPGTRSAPGCKSYSTSVAVPSTIRTAPVSTAAASIRLRPRTGNCPALPVCARPVHGCS